MWEKMQYGKGLTRLDAIQTGSDESKPSVLTLDLVSDPNEISTELTEDLIDLLNICFPYSNETDESLKLLIGSKGRRLLRLYDANNSLIGVSSWEIWGRNSPEREQGYTNSFVHVSEVLLHPNHRGLHNALALSKYPIERYKPKLISGVIMNPAILYLMKIMDTPSYTMYPSPEIAIRGKPNEVRQMLNNIPQDVVDTARQINEMRGSHLKIDDCLIKKNSDPGVYDNPNIWQKTAIGRELVLEDGDAICLIAKRWN